MPSASDELRDKIVSRFGSIDTIGPEAWLKDRGWTLASDWVWRRPGATWKTITAEERDCIRFLADEWDYGGMEDS